MGKVYGMILAGGTGTRMGNMEKPKQFLELDGKPIMIHTIEKFLLHPGFDEILVLSPRAWISYTEDIIRKFIPDRSAGTMFAPVTVLGGGVTRNETIMNGISYIDQQGCLDEDTVIVTHDSVRPFVTWRILDENIRYAKQFGACDTVIPATDTIVESCNHQQITGIPNREYMYQGQTPQSFQAKKLREQYLALTDEEKSILTDACKIMVMKGEDVRLVMGEVFNIKITYAYDLTIAKALLGMDLEETC